MSNGEASSEITEDNSRGFESRIVRGEETLGKRNIALRENAIKFLSIQRNEEENLSEEQIVAFKASEGALRLLQLDSLAEFRVGKKTGRLDSRKLKRHKDILGYSKIDSKEQILFLLISNTFNRTDELAETAIRSTRSHDSKSVGKEFLNNLLTKVRVSEFTDQGGDKVRVNFFEMFSHIKTLAELWNVNIDNWDNYVDTIIQGQAEGQEMLQKSRNAGSITYSSKEAVHYRRSTIGNYARLLGEALFGKDEKKVNTFVEQLMQTQVRDDQIDVFEDINSQVNPFVAILQEHDLLEDFINYSKSLKPSIAVSVHDYFTARFIRFKDKIMNMSFNDDVAYLRHSYAAGINT